MLIVALVLAVIGLAALVFAVVTSNELVAWVCIAASVLGVVLLIIDALQERRRREAGATPKESGPERVDEGVAPAGREADYADYPEENDETSAPAESETSAEEAAELDSGESVSDDHNTR